MMGKYRIPFWNPVLQRETGHTLLEIDYSILNILSVYHLLPTQSLSLRILNLESVHTK